MSNSPNPKFPPGFVPDPQNFPPGFVSDPAQAPNLTAQNAVIDRMQREAATPPSGFLGRAGQALGIPTTWGEVQAMRGPSTTPAETALSVLKRGVFGPIGGSLLGPLAGPMETAGRQLLEGGKIALREGSEAGTNIGEGQPVLPNIGKAMSGAVEGGIAALPMVGPSAVRMGKDIAAGNLRGAAGGALGTIAPFAVPALTEGAPRLMQPGAERVAGSLLGPEPKGTFEVSRPATALVAEGPVAATTKGLISNLEDLISGYNDQVQAALRQAAPGPPEDAQRLIQDAVQPIIDQARSGLDERTTQAIEKWRDESLGKVSAATPLDELYKLKQDIAKTARTYKGGQAEEPGLKEARQAVVSAINERVGQRLPGLSPITQRESGLIQGRDQLANRARLAAGGPLIPGLRTFVGGGAEHLGGAISARPVIPGETLVKTLLMRVMGERAPLGEITVPPIVPPPPTPQIRGLLGPGPIRMPAASEASPVGGGSMPTGPDTSGFPETMQPQPPIRFGGSVRGIPGEFAVPDYMRTERMLPAGKPTINVSPSTLPQSLAIRERGPLGRVGEPPAEPPAVIAPMVRSAGATARSERLREATEPTLYGPREHEGTQISAMRAEQGRPVGEPSKPGGRRTLDPKLRAEVDRLLEIDSHWIHPMGQPKLSRDDAIRQAKESLYGIKR